MVAASEDQVLWVGGEKPAPDTPEQRREKAWKRVVLLAHNHACKVCGSTQRVDVFPVVPFANGGKMEPANGHALCRECALLARVPAPKDQAHGAAVTLNFWLDSALDSAVQRAWPGESFTAIVTRAVRAYVEAPNQYPDLPLYGERPSQVRVSVRLPSDLRHRLHACAQRARMSIRDIIAALLQIHIALVLTDETTPPTTNETLQ